jgi:hypothetical protein
MTWTNLYFAVSLLKEYLMITKSNGFLRKWTKMIIEARKQKKQKKNTEYYEKQWEMKLRGLKR